MIAVHPSTLGVTNNSVIKRTAASQNIYQSGNEWSLLPMVQMSDSVCAGLPVQAYGTGLPGEATDGAGTTAVRRCSALPLRWATDTHCLHWKYIGLVYCLFVDVLCFDGVPWRILFCMVIIFSVWQLLVLARWCYGFISQWACCGDILGPRWIIK